MLTEDNESALYGDISLAAPDSLAGGAAGVFETSGRLAASPNPSGSLTEPAVLPG